MPAEHASKARDGAETRDQISQSKERKVIKLNQSKERKASDRNLTDGQRVPNLSDASTRKLPDDSSDLISETDVREYSSDKASNWITLTNQTDFS